MTDFSSLRYRRLLLRDIPEIQHLGRETYLPYYAHIWKPGGADWYLDMCFNRETLEAELSDPNVEYWTPINTYGVPMGLIKLELLRAIPDGGATDALHLEKIYLLPDFHRQGWGQVVMYWISERAQALGRSAIWLRVHKSGPVTAYEKAGFSIAALTHFEHALIPEPIREALTMTKPLTPLEMPVYIVPFAAELAIYFRDLNLAWIARFFRIEPHDLEQLESPKTEIMETGGQVFFALIGEQVVGTAAMVRDANGNFELAKMAVDPAFQGRQIGKRLGEATLAFARKRGAKQVWLESNRRLHTALNLYQSLGFREIPLTDTPYARADIKMVFDIEQ